MNSISDFEKIFQLDLVLLLVCDSEARIIKVNKAWETTLGYTEEELLGRLFFEFLHPDDRESTLEQLDLLNQNREVNRFVNRYRTKGGVYRYLEWNAQPDHGRFYSVARDITETVQVTEELRKQQERFELAVEGSSNGIWDWDVINDLHYFSPLWKQLLGFQDYELTNETHTFTDRLHPEDKEKIVQGLGDFVAGKDTVWDREFRLLHKNGSYRWIRARGKAFRDQEGRAYRMAGSHSDITERKEAETALRLSEEKYRLIAENTVDVIWVYDLERKKFQYISPAVESLLGYSVKEAMTLTLEDIVLPEVQSEIAQAIQIASEHFLQHPEEQMRYLRDLPHRKKDGSVIWVEQATTYRHSADGFLEIVGVTHNIDERRKIHVALRKSEERYRMILDHAPFPIVVARVSDGTLRYGNQRAKHQFGFADQDGIGLPSAQFYQDQQARVKFLQTLKEQGVVYDHEMNMLNWRGEPYTALMSASFVDFEDELGILVSVNDITDRKKAEEAIRFLSYHDNLTGLYNRHFYEELIEKPVPFELLPMALIVADVNGLKLANDAFGHPFGDRLLLRFAEVLKRDRASLDIAARIGGDEFVLFVPNAGEREVEAVLRKIETDCSKESVDSIGLSASLGAYVIADGSVLPQDAYKLAEDAMYRQKMVVGSQYRNSVVTRIIEDVFLKNPDDRLHSDTVEQISLALGTALAMNETELMDLKLAAQLHDIGKIGVDSNLTDLDERLEDLPNDEFKKHSPVGYYILHSASEYSHIAEFVLAHHERADGKGYPKGLLLEQIPLPSRIIRLANDLDLMQRKNEWGREKIIGYLEQNSGIVYDPELVRLYAKSVGSVEV